MGGSFGSVMRLFGCQFQGWDDYLAGSFKAGDEIIWVADLMLEWDYLGGSFRVGMRLFGLQF